jgi:hypothetical protein
MNSTCRDISVVSMLKQRKQQRHNTAAYSFGVTRVTALVIYYGSLWFMPDG